MSTLIKLHAIVTMDKERRVLPQGAIVIDGTRIEKVLTKDDLFAGKEFRGEILDATNLTAIPGFIQTHIHLCQTLFRGLADDLELLDWLRLKIFPLEAAHSDASMRASAMLGLAEIIHSGTTTIMDMGSVHHEDEVVRAIDEVGLRAFVGKAMMDQNDIYPQLREPTKDSLTSTLKQAEQWHQSSSGRIRYAVAPRFVLSCTDDLLKGAYEMTQSFPGMLFHTHAAENRHEMDAVRKRCNMDNIEFFESIGILHSNTCLAHCIWLNGREVELLHQRKAKVLHCPSSNLKLGSGIARVPELLARGVTVSLGADGAPCNNTLDMFHEMRLAALMQKPLHGPTAMSARSVFEMATLGGAATLGLDKEVGSIEPGKKADIVLLDLDRPWNPSAGDAGADLYSSIVYSCSPENVRSVMVDGRWLYRNQEYVGLDQTKVVQTARNELHKLQMRVV
jgi:cytosine/adenosine deaminase-related metal-dependent hydrolase